MDFMQHAKFVLSEDYIKNNPTMENKINKTVKLDLNRTVTLNFLVDKPMILELSILMEDLDIDIQIEEIIKQLCSLDKIIVFNSKKEMVVAKDLSMQHKEVHYLGLNGKVGELITLNFKICYI